MNTPNFDRIARAYRWLEYLSFGLLLERCRSEYLQDLKSAKHALVLGDGDGRFTARLLAENSNVLVDAVDSSQAMLSLLWQRACRQNAQARVTLHQQDIRYFSPQGEHDLIVSHFFLDCLTDAELFVLVRKVKATLRPKARWVVSEFAVPTSHWPNEIATLLITVLYKAFAWLTGLNTRHLPNHSLIFAEEGFVLDNERQRIGGILVSQIWRLQ
jgi:cyclopropane fatty-acyl-phospholipid synthase-like methyltransferase